MRIRSQVWVRSVQVKMRGRSQTSSRGRTHGRFALVPSVCVSVTAITRTLRVPTPASHRASSAGPRRRSSPLPRLEVELCKRKTSDALPRRLASASSPAPRTCVWDAIYWPSLEMVCSRVVVVAIVAAGAIVVLAWVTCTCTCTCTWPGSGVPGGGCRRGGRGRRYCRRAYTVVRAFFPVDVGVQAKR